MNIFRKLFQSFTPPPGLHGNYYSFSVKCKRCGEVIHAQVNVYNDPSLEFDERGKPFFVCRKVLVGSAGCFQQIEAIFKFDESRRVLERQITGGEFVENEG
jgi:hypothetical protein